MGISSLLFFFSFRVWRLAVLVTRYVQQKHVYEVVNEFPATSTTRWPPRLCVSLNGLHDRPIALSLE